jgi:hypothetical protein
MTSIAIVDPVVARRQTDGQEGAHGPDKRQRREEAAKPAVTFGGALSHLNETPRAQQVSPTSVTERPRQRDPVRASEERPPRHEEPDAERIREPRLREELAAYDERQLERAGERVDLEV